MNSLPHFNALPGRDVIKLIALLNADSIALLILDAAPEMVDATALRAFFTRLLIAFQIVDTRDLAASHAPDQSPLMSAVATLMTPWITLNAVEITVLMAPNMLVVTALIVPPQLSQMALAKATNAEKISCICANTVVKNALICSQIAITAVRNPSLVCHSVVNIATSAATAPTTIRTGAEIDVNTPPSVASSGCTNLIILDSMPKLETKPVIILRRGPAAAARAIIAPITAWIGAGRFVNISIIDVAILTTVVTMGAMAVASPESAVCMLSIAFS